MKYNDNKFTTEILLQFEHLGTRTEIHASHQHSPYSLANRSASPFPEDVGSALELLLSLALDLEVIGDEWDFLQAHKT